VSCTVEIREPCDLSDIQRDVLHSVAELSVDEPLPNGKEIEDDVQGDRSEATVDESTIYNTLRFLSDRRLISETESDQDSRVNLYAPSHRGLSLLRGFFRRYEFVDESHKNAVEVPDGTGTTPGDDEDDRNERQSNAVPDGGATVSAPLGDTARQWHCVGVAKDLRNHLAQSEKEAVTISQATEILGCSRSLVEDVIEFRDEWFTSTTKTKNGDSRYDAVAITEAGVEEASEDPYCEVDVL
jgi:DNA-binding PadR family transcriptional regulator